MVGTGLSIDDVMRLTREMRDAGVSAFKACGVEVEFSGLAQIDASKKRAPKEDAAEEPEGAAPDDVIDEELLFHSTDDVVKPGARQ